MKGKDRDVTLMKQECSSKDKEINYLQGKIDRLSEPVAIKYEKDGLVQTYKKRNKELEEYIKVLEGKLADFRT